MATSLYSFKIAYDPDFSRFSPGTQLSFRVIERFHERGFVLADSCAISQNPHMNRLVAGSPPAADPAPADGCSQRPARFGRPSRRGPSPSGSVTTWSGGGDRQSQRRSNPPAAPARMTSRREPTSGQAQVGRALRGRGFGGPLRACSPVAGPGASVSAIQPASSRTNPSEITKAMPETDDRSVMR